MVNKDSRHKWLIQDDPPPLLKFEVFKIFRVFCCSVAYCVRTARELYYSVHECAKFQNNGPVETSPNCIGSSNEPPITKN